MKLAGVIICILLASGDKAPTAHPDSNSPVVATRGIACEFTIRLDSPHIRARADQTRASLAMVRLLRLTDANANGPYEYRVNFIGLFEGDFDLGSFLESSAGELSVPPIPIRVESKLTPDHGTDLFAESITPVLSRTQYTAGMVALGIVWACIPVIYKVSKSRNGESVKQDTMVAPKPSLADQLRPLVASALQKEMSVSQQARLELLLYSYWRGKLQLTGPQKDVIAKLRRDAQAGQLLRAIESWLHAAPASSSDFDSAVAELLTPYENVPAMQDTPGNRDGAGS